MKEQDFSKRLTIVVRRDLESWQVANTIAHISAYIGNVLRDDFGTGDFFVSSDGVSFPRNTQYPIIIKSADSDAQLKNLYTHVSNAKLIHHVFFREMIETTDDAEIEKLLQEKEGSEVEFLGIGVFGGHEDILALTKKFSLWK